ncbi:MAG: IS110 family transposase, partial [Gammaproteobacteria bacterium]
RLKSHSPIAADYLRLSSGFLQSIDNRADDYRQALSKIVRHEQTWEEAMNYHTALDVSLRSVSICIVDDEGAIQFEAKVPSEVEEIDKCLRRFDPEIKSVGFEAGTLTQYLTYGLQAAGYDVICLEARQVSAALSAMRNKTDKNDARGIAQILRTGWYSRVHVRLAGGRQGDSQRLHDG